MLEALALAILIGLGGYRATRLIIKDDIFNKPRQKILMARIPTKLTTLMMCPWCVSAYVTGIAFLVVWWLHPVALPLLVWMAAWSWTVSQYKFVDPS